jgi:two-component system chemotaxis response regulator CheB
MSNLPFRASLSVFSKKIIVIGASTGGPGALRELLKAMPPEAPGMVIALHMLGTFTKLLAERLNKISRIKVREAQSGDRIMQGQALIAPGDRHIQIVRRSTDYAVEVFDGPPINHYQPSIDILFGSVAKVVGAEAVGVIMTGMGYDGAQGLLEMKRSGAATIAQDEATSVVFGMPNQAINRGAVDEVVPLSLLPRTILRRARSE